MLEDCVVSNHDGERQLFVPAAHTIASTNPEWIEAVQASERFGSQEWSAVTRVRSITLDQAVGRFGVPAFCKIDVEGAEHEVLQGLSSPVPLIAFEHTPEYPRSTIGSIACLSALGPYEWNYSQGESAKLLAGEWLSQSELEATLTQLPLSGFGDVYARLQGSSKGRV